MTRFLEMRRFACAISVLILLFAMVFGSHLSAQTARDAVTDSQIHKFQPPVAPERAVATATSRERSRKANGMSIFAARQISALQHEKLSRTPAQTKIDSNVLYTLRMLTGQEAAPGVPYLYTGVDLDVHNNVVVDMVANVTESLLSKLSAAGAQVLYSNVSLRSIRAIIPPSEIEGIAASPDVIFISPRQESLNNRRNPAPSGAGVSDMLLAPGFDDRAERVRQQLAKAMATHGTPITWQGSVGTEGDLTHQAVDARGAFGINGAGLKIGVLSDGVSHAALSQATGDLPPTCGTPPCLTVLSGQAGSGDEGTAILEIIHDMVPGASLYFATADNSITSFAANIEALQAAGCQIIVDDVYYYVETPFQDGQTTAVVSNTNAGVVTQAVNDVVSKGVFYFSSAGNEGNLDDGTSGTFEGDFVPQAAASPLPSGNVHNFGSGNGFDTITSPGQQIIGLWWSDPLGGSSNDYDLYLLNNTGTAIVAASTNIQSGTQDPVELIDSANVVDNNQIVVFQNTGASNRFFHLVLFRGGLAVNTSGETHGHSAASGAYTVAATPAAVAFGPPTPNGPYPGPFVASDQIEYFSSDGLRHIFFNADSTPITPGNFSSTGGSVLDKPDITAADGVSVTGVGGFSSPFYGTSAAAPSAASVAALVLSAKPSITADEMKTALEDSAIDIMASGFDRDSGHGIVMALAAVKSLGVTGFANPELATITASENPGNGNGIIEAGEGALLQIQLKNKTGIKAATGIKATLTSSTPGVIIQQPGVSAYKDLAAGAGPESNLTPFEFALADNLPCGQLVDFTLTVKFSGNQTRVLNFSVQTGMLTITNTLGTPITPPSPLTFATGTQASRINRNGVVSSCGTAKSFPGTITGTHTFDAYTFPACQAICLEPQLNAGAAGINLFESLYSPSYDPTSIGTNYSGDAGLSGNTQSFGVDITANTNYTVVINDVGGNPPPASPPDTYTIQIPSCAFNCNPYPLPVAIAHNVTVSAATNGGSANASVNNGSFDPDGGPVTITQSPAGPYPQGTTHVILTVTNKVGGFSQANATVTVVEPVIRVSPSSIDFETVYLNSVNYKIVTVTNLRSESITINDPLISIVKEGDSKEFVAENLCPKPLAAHASCTIKIVFVAGPFYHQQSATLSVESSPGSPLPVSLTALTIDPQAQLNTTSLSFGTQKEGTSSAAKPVTITNTGATALTIHSVAATGSDPHDFIVANHCPSSLGAGDGCTIDVTFKPEAKGSRSAHLVITDNAQSSPQSVSLSGTGD
jgi:Subtilase family/Abnormal spindle-like microcephaly-assoc'd, ASPM-SPD-2-Hydin